MSKIRVMVADDHPGFRDGLSRILSDETDFEIVANPRDGEQAIELASKLKPHVIVMDISMPRLNGIEAARQIKADCPDIAILMVSAYSYPSYALAALRAGADGYLLKNASIKRLLGAIRLVSSGEGVFYMKTTGSILHRLAGNKVEKRKDLEELRPREMQVLTLVAQGLGNKGIAQNLEISESTVQTHMVNIFRKLQVSSRTEAVLQGLKKGWMTLDDLPANEESDQ
jgi:DNA-binding NarL/FixJ family response regulator